MKNKLLFLTTLFTVVFAIAFTSCKKKNDDDITNPDGGVIDTTVVDTSSDFTSLYDVIIQADTFDLLVEAVQKAGLVETLKQQTGAYTIFLPTDAAITAYLNSNEVTSIPDAVLLYHVLGNKILKSADFGAYQTTMSDCNGMLSLYISTQDSLNGEAAIVKKDVEADNGVIHVIDAVLELPSVMTFIKIDPEVKLYYEGIKYFDEVKADGYSLSDELMDEEMKYTVFAPVNEGVTTFLNNYYYNDTPAESWEEYQGTMRVLDFHISDTIIVKAQFQKGTELYRSGSYFNDTYLDIVEVTPNTIITGEFDNGEGWSNLTTTNYLSGDIRACNGVLHRVDAVLYEDYSQVNF